MYKYLAATRILLIFIPWMGYIHPDEFFQTLEVVAGKFLHVENTLTWEFNTTSPIRSMALPYFTLGMSYKLLLGVDYILKTFLASYMFTTYFVLLIPRLFMCASSFAVDYSLYKICFNNNERCSSRLIILSSSYVIIVYATKTLTNSFELYLFSLLLYYVCESLTFSNQILRKKEYVQYRYSKSTSIPEKAKFHKLNLYLTTDSFRNCFWISTIVVFGFFNRPTFLAYSVIPLFMWLYRGIGSKIINNIHFHLRILALIVFSFPSLIFIVLVDSFYYGFITWGDLGMLDVSINSFVFTPLNFVKYNINPDNLAKHGLHSKYLHTFVSMPLLFGLLTIFHYYTLGNYCHRLSQGKFNLLPAIRSIKCLMILSTVVPLVILSIFPHQEPRFMIPLLLPLVYLHGPNLLPEKEQEVMKAEGHSPKATCVKKPSNGLLIVWFVANFILMIFFGYLHQGGVVSAVSHLSKVAKKYDKSVEIHVFSSHNYMLPHSLFLQPKSDIKVNDFLSDAEAYKKRIYVHEEGSSDVGYLLKKIELVRSQKLYRKRLKMFLLIPNNFRYEVIDRVAKTNLSISEIEVFYPHISLEALSTVGDYYYDLFEMFNYDLLQDFTKMIAFLRHLLYPFGLGIFEISTIPIA